MAHMIGVMQPGYKGAGSGGCYESTAQAHTPPVGTAGGDRRSS